MKSKKKWLKALPLACLAVCAGLGTTMGVVASQHANTTTTNTTLVKQAYNPDQYVSIDGWFTGAASNLSTINGQEIVTAIKSFNQDHGNITNQNDAYNFVYYKGETAIVALMKQIKENIKYLKQDDYTTVYDLPDEIIRITPQNNFNLFNVYIDVGAIGGNIVYFEDFNPSINSSQLNLQKPMGRQVVPHIQFNAISYMNVDMPILESAQSAPTLSVIYIILGITGGILLLSIIIYLIKKHNSQKYMY